MEVFIESSGYSFTYEGQKKLIEFGNLVAYRINILEKYCHDLESKQIIKKELIDKTLLAQIKVNEELSQISMHDITEEDIRILRQLDDDLRENLLDYNNEFNKNAIKIGFIKTEVNSVKNALTNEPRNNSKLLHIIQEYFSEDMGLEIPTKTLIKDNKIQYVYILPNEYVDETVDIYKTLNPLFLFDLYMVIKNKIGFAVCIECSRLIRYKRNTVKYCDSCKYRSDQKKQKKIQPHNALCNKLRRRIKFPNDNYASILRLYQDAYGQYSRRYSYDELLAFINAVNEKTKSRSYNDIADFRNFLNEYTPKKEGEPHETP